METTYDIAFALAIAAAVISLFAIIRLAFRSSTTPDWVRSTFPAYFIALLLTFAIAGSLFYLAYALAGALPAWIAFFGTFAVHIGLVAVFLKLLPVTEEPMQVSTRARQTSAQRATA